VDGAFRDLAPITHYSQDDALVLEPGDTLRRHVRLDQRHQRRPRFPQEMCVRDSEY